MSQTVTAKYNLKKKNFVIYDRPTKPGVYFWNFEVPGNRSVEEVKKQFAANDILGAPQTKGVRAGMFYKNGQMMQSSAEIDAMLLSAANQGSVPDNIQMAPYMGVFGDLTTRKVSFIGMYLFVLIEIPALTGSGAAVAETWVDEKGRIVKEVDMLGKVWLPDPKTIQGYLSGQQLEGPILAATLAVITWFASFSPLVIFILLALVALGIYGYISGWFSTEKVPGSAGKTLSMYQKFKNLLGKAGETAGKFGSAAVGIAILIGVATASSWLRK